MTLQTTADPMAPYNDKVKKAHDEIAQGKPKAASPSIEQVDNAIGQALKQIANLKPETLNQSRDYITVAKDLRRQQDLLAQQRAALADLPGKIAATTTTITALKQELHALTDEVGK